MTKKCSKHVPKCPQNSPKTFQKCPTKIQKKTILFPTSFKKMSNLIKNMSGWSSSVVFFNLLHPVDFQTIVLDFPRMFLEYENDRQPLLRLKYFRHFLKLRSPLTSNIRCRVTRLAIHRHALKPSQT